MLPMNLIYQQPFRYHDRSWGTRKPESYEAMSRYEAIARERHPQPCPSANGTYITVSKAIEYCPTMDGRTCMNLLFAADVVLVFALAL